MSHDRQVDDGGGKDDRRREEAAALARRAAAPRLHAQGDVDRDEQNDEDQLHMQPALLHHAGLHDAINT